MKNKIINEFSRSLKTRFTLTALLKIFATILIVKFIYYFFYTTTTNQSLIGLFLLPIRGARTLFKLTHKILKFDGTRLLITKTLKQFNRPIRNTALLKRFGWFKLLGFLIGESVFTLMVAVISFILLLILAGFWAYISQEHLTKFGIIISYLPVEQIFDGFKSYPIFSDIFEFYTNTFKPFLMNPATELTKWEIFKNFVLDFFILAIFKLSITTIHEWPTFISIFMDDCLPYLYFNDKWESLGIILGFYCSIIQVYFIEPTIALGKAILLIPFKGLAPLIATNWLGEIVWCLTSYYTAFQELYWKYVWNYEYVPKPVKWLKEYFYKDNIAYYTGKHYKVDDLWVSVTDSDEAAKLVDGEALAPEKGKNVEGSSKNVTSQSSNLGTTGEDLTGRKSPVEELTKEVESEWTENTPKGKGKELSDNYDDGVGDSPICDNDEGKLRQHNRFFKEAKVNSSPIYISENPTPDSYIVNLVLTGRGVLKNDEIMYYERTPVNYNNCVREGGPNMYSIQPEPEYEMKGTVSWKWFLMTNPKVISLLCFSSTLVAGLAIKGAIMLGVDYAIAILS